MNVERKEFRPDERYTSASSTGRSPWVQRLTLLALASAIGIAAAEIGLRFGGSLARVGGLHLDDSQTITVIAACLIALLVVLLVHELGHLLGGRLVGFRAFLLIIGPLRLERSQAGWAMHLNQELALYGGMAGSAATDARDLGRRTAVLVAGGPVASAALALGAALVLHALDLSPRNANASFTSLLCFLTLQALSLVSAAICIVTLVPMQTSGFLTDGARLLRLLRGGPVAERDIAIQAIIGSSLSGVRPRDWDTALIDTARELRDGSLFEFIALQFAQMHVADRGDFEHSLVLLRQLLQDVDRIPKLMIAAIHLDAARQFALAGLVNEARAHTALAKGPVMGAPYLKPLAEAALLAAEGRDVESAALLQTIRPMLARSIDRGASRWLTDAIDELQARINSQLAR